LVPLVDPSLNIMGGKVSFSAVPVNKRAPRMGASSFDVISKLRFAAGVEEMGLFNVMVEVFIS